jgi:predicted nucleic acid-binding protein
VNVYSNTTPFIALASIDRLGLLPQIFGKIYVAEAVIAECSEGGRILMPNLKALEWVMPVADDEISTLPVLFELDRGEKQTIILALKHSADMVIIDERIGRRVAEYLGLHVTGTLGVLAKAKSLGLIPSFNQAAMDMRQQGIHYNSALIARLAQHLGEVSQ